MRKATKKAFDHVERDDPRLAVDGLGEFLPSRTDPEVDQTLTVNALEELFPSPSMPPPVVISEAPLPTAADPALAADGLDEYFDDPAETSTPESSELASEVGHVAPEPEEFDSPTRRFAAEFQRFADKFHAFASECRQ